MRPLNIRPATTQYVPLILAMIHELAVFEREPDAVKATETDLLRDGFGTPAQKRFECVLAEWDGAPAGFALYFHNYSTWRGRAGIHLEDLFVREPFRRRGIGKALLSHLAGVLIAEGGQRLQWDVLEWNRQAIDFYQSLGAEMLMEWRTMRVTGCALARLAAMLEP